MKKSILTLLAVFFIAGLASCTMRLTDFTLISSKNVDLSRLAEYQRGTSRVEGEDRVHLILTIPTKFQITIKEAMDKAIESIPGAVALIDGVVSFEQVNIPILNIIYANRAFIVEGTPLIDPKLASYQFPESNYMISNLDSDGKVSSVQYVSKEEYTSMRDKIYK
ncbi:MAG: hypothetical protein C4581_01010 [Nitrospiraceae bacterium]|nr:MAG: hypothetical protein C4581_01010 [Nitrospiraceae bacterium]